MDLVTRARAYMEEQVRAGTRSAVAFQRCTKLSYLTSGASQVLFGLMGEVLRPFPRLLAAARDQGQELLREQEAHVRAHIELMIGCDAAAQEQLAGGAAGRDAGCNTPRQGVVWGWGWRWRQAPLALHSHRPEAPSPCMRRQQRVVMTLNHYYVDTVNCLRGAALQMRETVRADGHLTDEKAAGFKKEYGEALFVSAARAMHQGWLVGASAEGWGEGMVRREPACPLRHGRR